MIETGPWARVELLRPLAGGHRNEVWQAEHEGRPVVVRQSRRPVASLSWELDLLARLDEAGFVVPTIVPTDDGRPSAAGVVVQRWLDGREPSSASDWRLVAAELERLHAATRGHPQRPGCATVAELATARRSVDADLDAMPTEAAALVLSVFDNVVGEPGPEGVPASPSVAVVHGDPGAANIRIGPDGSVGLLDWDESRVDLTWLDLADLGVRVLDDARHRRARLLADAWEAANAWTAEPDYARRRLDALADRL